MLTLVFQLVCLIKVIGSGQEILSWELHVGKSHWQGSWYIFPPLYIALFLFLYILYTHMHLYIYVLIYKIILSLIYRMAPEVLQPGSGYDFKWVFFHNIKIKFSTVLVFRLFLCLTLPIPLHGKTGVPEKERGGGWCTCMTSIKWEVLNGFGQ